MHRGKVELAMRTVSARVQIRAEPMTVWAILTDLSSYHEWNPLFVQASGDIAVGARVTLRSVHPDGGRTMTVKPRILVADAAAELRWASGLPGIISGEHSFLMSAADGGTRLVQSETFRGLLVPFSRAVLAGAQSGFEVLNEALRKRAEAG